MSARLERRVLAKTAAYTITPPQDRPGLTFTNRAAVGSVTFTLPAATAAVKGWWYDFLVHADQSLIVAGATAGKIATPGNAAADNVGFQTASKKVGGRILAICDGTQWICIGIRAGSGFCVNGTEVKLDDSVTAGTALASRPVVLDANAAVDGMTLGKGTGITFGLATVLGKLFGTLANNFSAAGVGNAADTTDDTLFTQTIKANTLDANGKWVFFTAFGTTAANGNNKRIIAKLGAATLVTSGVVTSNNLAWLIEGFIVRTSVGNQLVIATLSIGTAVIAMTVSKPTADETTDLSLVITGASSTTGAANDVLGNGLLVQASN